MFQHLFNILRSFEDAGAEIFIGWEDDEVLRVLELKEELALERRQVMLYLAAAEACFDFSEEVRNSSTDFDGNRFRWGFPVSSDEQLVWVIFVRASCKDYLGVDISAESGCNCVKVTRSGGVWWLGAEIESESQQGLKLLGRVQVCA